MYGPIKKLALTTALLGITMGCAIPRPDSIPKFDYSTGYTQAAIADCDKEIQLTPDHTLEDSAALKEENENSLCIEVDKIVNDKEAVKYLLRIRYDSQTSQAAADFFRRDMKNNSIEYLGQLQEYSHTLEQEIYLCAQALLKAHKGWSYTGDNKDLVSLCEQALERKEEFDNVATKLYQAFSIMQLKAPLQNPPEEKLVPKEETEEPEEPENEDSESKEPERREINASVTF